MCLRKCGPNEVLVISGCCLAKNKYVKARSHTVILPGQKVQRLSTETMTMHVETRNIVTKNGIPITAHSVVQVKIYTKSDEMLDRACDTLLGKPRQEVETVIRQPIIDSQSAVLATVTPEDTLTSRKQINIRVFNRISADLAKTFGVVVVSYALRECTDEQGYFKKLGVERMKAAEAEKQRKREENARWVAEMKEQQKLQDEAQRKEQVEIERSIEEDMRVAMEWETGKKAGEDMRVAMEWETGKKAGEDMVAEFSGIDVKIAALWKMDRTERQSETITKESLVRELCDDLEIITKNNAVHQLATDLEIITKNNAVHQLATGLDCLALLMEKQQRASQTSAIPLSLY